MVSKKNITIFFVILFLITVCFLPNNFVSAVEYTEACPESAAIYSACTIDGKTGKCQLKNINGKATKTCVAEENTAKPTEKALSAEDSVSEVKNSTNETKTSGETKASNSTKTQGNLVLEKPTFNGIVPCGTDETGPCTLCHLIIGIQRIFKYGLYLVTTMAFVGIFIGGAMYMISAGDSGMMESAKKFVAASLIGFAIVLGAWLIVNIILNVLPLKDGMGVGKTKWYEFSCSTTSSNMPSTSSEESKEETKDKKIPCGDGGRGTCFITNQATSTNYGCPSSYIPLDGGVKCKSDGLSFNEVSTCCISVADTIKTDSSGKQYQSCGKDAAGTCFLLEGTDVIYVVSNLVTLGMASNFMKNEGEIRCPDGWEWLREGGNSCSTKGIWQTWTKFTKCCKPSAN